MKIIRGHHLIICGLLALHLFSCSANSHKFEPHVTLTATHREVARLTPAFPSLTREEKKEPWGRELLVATHFGRDTDLYRAITAFRRALILMPSEILDRRMQAEFGIIESYWLGGKYCEALETFDESSLKAASHSFPAIRELLIILHDCYDHTEDFERAEALLRLICKHDGALANDLQLSIALREGDIASAATLAVVSNRSEPIDTFITDFCHCRKSVTRAQTLNAILPGAGYYYVGQKQSALTSFIINSLFIGATYHFFHHGNYPAGLITATLESGWYFGGINGAGLAAKEYNEQTYRCSARAMMVRNNLFPLLMLEASF